MRLKTLLLILFVLALALPALAQDAVRTDVTADEINAIARKLYCPVCENIPLDACGAAACDDWRYEIRLQLEAGLTEQEIINDFVRRFGDRAVGIPQDPTLRALALIMPWLAMGAAIVGGGWFLLRRRVGHTSKQPLPANEPSGKTCYYELLQRDID
ncbi:MAG: cytochrome c-type biogenesis protein CcmH [Aggregatilineales bacterium]